MKSPDQITIIGSTSGILMAKQKFKIINWPTYNKVLRQRG
jgi:hypothetical protein